ncbi:MAG: hypothetical protein ISF22_00905 [Methanomassiliicoccus sp.]|nr:hypothetical protein [Methanomassiliicoccus sp.]
MSTGTMLGYQSGDGVERRRPVLPASLLERLVSGRAAIFGALRSSAPRAPGAYPSHLPAVVTRGTVNTSVAGMGPLPRGEEITEYTDLFRDACRRGDPEVKGEAALWFYSDTRHFDPAVLGGLMPLDDEERSGVPFGGSIVLIDGPSGHRGRRVYGLVETVDEGDQRYEFLLSAWTLLASGHDDITRERFPRAWLFRPAGYP